MIVLVDVFDVDRTFCCAETGDGVFRVGCVILMCMLGGP